MMLIKKETSLGIGLVSLVATYLMFKSNDKNIKTAALIPAFVTIAFLPTAIKQYFPKNETK